MVLAFSWSYFSWSRASPELIMPDTWEVDIYTDWVVCATIGLVILCQMFQHARVCKDAGMPEGHP